MRKLRIRQLLAADAKRNVLLRYQYICNAFQAGRLIDAGRRPVFQARRSTVAPFKFIIKTLAARAKHVGYKPVFAEPIAVTSTIHVGQIHLWASERAFWLGTNRHMKDSLGGQFKTRKAIFK